MRLMMAPAPFTLVTLLSTNLTDILFLRTAQTKLAQWGLGFGVLIQLAAATRHTRQLVFQDHISLKVQVNV